MTIILKKTEIWYLFYTVSAYKLVDELMRRWSVARTHNVTKHFLQNILPVFKFLPAYAETQNLHSSDLSMSNVSHT